MRKYSTSILALLLIALLFANSGPMINAVGQDIVNPKQIYTYEIMQRDLQALAKRYPARIATGSIGTSEYGRELNYIDLGNGPAILLLNGSHHAREWITTVLLMRMVEHYAQADQAGAQWGEHAVSDLLDQVTIRVVPMLNPDGVTLQQKGLASFPKEDHEALLKMNGGKKDFKRWKANGKGIDLNRQYPAEWNSINQPAPGPHYMNYKGSKPLQAKEAIAMAQFTIDSDPEMALAYHSSGEIVYWNFNTPQQHVQRDRAIVSLYGKMTGYRIVAPVSNPSGGGYTDWFISEFGRPGMTPELARPAGETHVPLAEWDRIWKQHQHTGWMLALETVQLRMDRQQVARLDEPVRLLQDEKAYQWPNMKSRHVGTAAAGHYVAAREKGGWLELVTEQGAWWIPPRAVLRGEQELLDNFKVQVDNDTLIYDTPLSGTPSTMRFSPQAVTVLARWGDWYSIQTWKGERWVRAEQTTPVELSPQQRG